MAKDGSGAQFSVEEIKAIVETANDYGFKVAAHAHGAEGMKTSCFRWSSFHRTWQLYV
jgi:imidazolonepropionase-like amidohydrolase